MAEGEVSAKRVPVPKTELERHEGWLENLKNEERTMKESLQKCIAGKYTRDPARVQQILDFAYPESETGSRKGKRGEAWLDNTWVPTGKLAQMEAKKQS